MQDVGRSVVRVNTGDGSHSVVSGCRMWASYQNNSDIHSCSQYWRLNKDKEVPKGNFISNDSVFIPETVNLLLELNPVLDATL